MVNDFDFSSYQSPIERVVDEVFNDLVKQDNDHLMAQVRIAVGYDVKEDELIKALQYDRHQYEVGYTDGRLARDREIVRCRDCKNWDTTWQDWAKNYHYCPLIDGIRNGDWFCADAERRDKQNDPE